MMKYSEMMNEHAKVLGMHPSVIYQLYRMGVSICKINDSFKSTFSKKFIKEYILPGCTLSDEEIKNILNDGFVIKEICKMSLYELSKMLGKSYNGLIDIQREIADIKNKKLEEHIDIYEIVDADERLSAIDKIIEYTNFYAIVWFNYDDKLKKDVYTTISLSSEKYPIGANMLHLLNSSCTIKSSKCNKFLKSKI